MKNNIYTTKVSNYDYYKKNEEIYNKNVFLYDKERYSLKLGDNINEYDYLLKLGKIIKNGVIIMWSGKINEIPIGWALCDGNNGTPDLSNKFIKGVSSNNDDPGKTGGNNSIKIKTENIPSHSHKIIQTPHSHTATHSHNANDLLSVTNSGGHKHSVRFSSHGMAPGDGGFLTRDMLYSNTVATDSKFSLDPGGNGKYQPGGYKDFTSAEDKYQTPSVSPIDNVMDPSGNHTHNISGGTITSVDFATYGHNTKITMNNNKTIKETDVEPINIEPKYYKLAFIMKIEEI